MKFKIKKQLLNESEPTETSYPTKMLPGNLGKALGIILAYDKELNEEPPIDALRTFIQEYLNVPDPIQQEILKNYNNDKPFSDFKTFNPSTDAEKQKQKLSIAMHNIFKDYKDAKAAAKGAADAERDAAANKEKEAQQAPMKKAIRTLVLFALNSTGTDLWKSGDFKYDNDKLIQYMDKVKEALKFVQEHELENLEEVRLMEATNVETLINKAFDNPEDLTKIINIVKERIKGIEDEKAGRERADADAKAKAEKFEKNKELLFKVLRFFQEKVGIESIRIPAYDRSNEVRSNKKIANLAKELRKDFPTFDTLYNFLDKIIEEIIEKLGDAIDGSGNLQSGASEASIRLYAELKTIAKKFRKTILKLLEFNESWRQLPADDRKDYGAPQWNLKTDGINKLWGIIDAVVSESKKYKLKLIENKRG